MKLSVMAVVTAISIAHDISDDFMDWECPGFPCFIVNYFDQRPATDMKQTCTPLHSFTHCQYLQEGQSFPVRYNNYTAAGWHNMTRPHPCAAVDFGCMQNTNKTVTGHQGACLQGSLSKCKSLCDNLNLLAPYDGRCYSRCEAYCPEPFGDLQCSDCESHGYGADECGCGYCGSFGGCGFTCGKDPNQASLGPKCFNLPPSPSPTPVLPPTPAPGYTTSPPETTTTPSPTPSPTPSAFICSECESHGF